MTSIRDREYAIHKVVRNRFDRLYRAVEVKLNAYYTKRNENVPVKAGTVDLHKKADKLRDQYKEIGRQINEAEQPLFQAISIGAKQFDGLKERIKEVREKVEDDLLVMAVLKTDGDMVRVVDDALAEMMKEVEELPA